MVYIALTEFGKGFTLAKAVFAAILFICSSQLGLVYHLTPKLCFRHIKTVRLLYYVEKNFVQFFHG